jgi:hypothetical protein
MVAPENAVVTRTNATGTGACMMHADDQSACGRDLAWARERPGNFFRIIDSTLSIFLNLSVAKRAFLNHATTFFEQRA